MREKSVAAQDLIMPSMPAHQYVLTLSCPDRPGIVSAVSTFLAHNGQNILDAQQFDDIETKKFSMRIPFHHLPVTKETRREQERALLDLVGDTGTDLVVLARF